MAFKGLKKALKALKGLRKNFKKALQGLQWF